MPVLLMLTLAILVPSLWAGVISLRAETIGEPARFVGLSNYIRVLADGGFWNALRNTLVFVVTSVAGELLVGLAGALILSRGFPLQPLWLALVLAPYAASPVVVVVMWKWMIQPDVGLLNYLLALVGIRGLQWTFDPALSFLLIVLMEVWRQAPFTLIILYAAILSIPPEVMEAARVDGASGVRSLFGITLPLIMPALLVALIFRVIFAIRAFDHIWVFNQGGPFGATEVLSIYLYRWGFRYWEAGLASAVAVLMLLLTAGVAGYYVYRSSQAMFGKKETV